MPKIRLDALMVQRGLAESRDWAQRLIRAGEVRVNAQVIATPSKTFADDPAMSIVVAQPPKYVSRGGLKLEGALTQFGIDPSGWVCADVGSSTGGFSDCLLQHGAAKIHAFDVGKGQMHWRLRNDPRIVLREGVNVRYEGALPELVRLVVIDVSFISLELILPVVWPWLVPGGEVVALVKPQFEAGKSQVGRGGIVRDPAVHQAVIERLTAFIIARDWAVARLIDSPILGTEGNREFLMRIHRAPRAWS